MRPQLLIALSAVSFAVMGVATKLAAGELSGPQISAVRFALMLIPLLVFPGALRSALTFERVDLLLYRGVFGGIAALLYFLAIQHLPVGLATLINFTSPVFSVVFAAIFLGEGLDRRLGLPLLATAVGVGLVVGGKDGDLAVAGWSGLGPWEATALTSAVLGGAAVTAVRAARRSENSWSIYASFSVFGLVAALPFVTPATGATWVSPTPRLAALLLVVGATSITAQLAMTFAYKWVTTLQAGIILQLTVLISLLLGVTLLGERLVPAQLVGCVFTLTGVVGVIVLQGPPRAVA